MTITFNSVFNVLILFVAAYRFFMIYIVWKRIDKSQRSRAFPGMLYPLVGTVIFVCGVSLPILHHKTLNVDVNRALFFGGFAIILVPDLILWWKKRSMPLAE